MWLLWAGYVPTLNVHSDVWNHVEFYTMYMLLACRLKITFTFSLKLIITFLVQLQHLLLPSLIVTSSQVRVGTPLPRQSCCISGLGPEGLLPVPRMMLYLMLSLSNTYAFCWLMRLFLSNFGILMSCIVTTSCVLRQTVRVFTSLVSPSNFVIMPFGKADLLIKETFKPEPKSTRKSLWLLIVPIVSAVQMVTGDSCLGILILGPW